VWGKGMDLLLCVGKMTNVTLPLLLDILQSITEKKEVYEEAPDTPFEKTSAAVHSTLILENSLLFLITLFFYCFIYSKKKNRGREIKKKKKKNCTIKSLY
jgi:hypothetical protein